MLTVKLVMLVVALVVGGQMADVIDVLPILDTLAEWLAKPLPIPEVE